VLCVEESFNKIVRNPQESMELDTESIILAGLLLFAALLYSSVGHGGASGYLAAMALVGISPEIMKPTALALNIIVAVIATFKFYGAGSFSWKIFLPLAVSAMPLAYLGGTLSLPANIYKPIVGIVLVYAAWRSFKTANNASTYHVQEPSVLFLLLGGASLGFLSGLTGVGGGIFLSPLLLFFRWAPIKVISGVASAFILANSIAGLLGVMSVSTAFHPVLPLWGIMVLVGGYLGAEYGSKRLGNSSIQRLLALVLVVAGAKMITTA
jgi:hypothetical protein